jgi:hypothetical protein
MLLRSCLHKWSKEKLGAMVISIINRHVFIPIALACDAINTLWKAKKDSDVGW